jgi:hypothetical protein
MCGALALYLLKDHIVHSSSRVPSNPWPDCEPKRAFTMLELAKGKRYYCLGSKNGSQVYFTRRHGGPRQSEWNSEPKLAQRKLKLPEEADAKMGTETIQVVLTILLLPSQCLWPPSQCCCVLEVL